MTASVTSVMTGGTAHAARTSTNRPRPTRYVERSGENTKSSYSQNPTRHTRLTLSAQRTPPMADPRIDPRMIEAAMRGWPCKHRQPILATPPGPCDLCHEDIEYVLTAALRAAREAGGDKIDTETGRLEKWISQLDSDGLISLDGSDET